ncbi:hypothetical protein ZWY2020_003391, partial [Hordeum vulgare]
SALVAAEAIAKENKVSPLLGGSGPTLHKAAQHAASSHPLVNKVLVVDSDVFAHPLAEPWAELLRSVQQKGGYSHVIASSTLFGKNLLPRAAALLDVSPVTDVTAISKPRVFSPCMMSIRSTSFSPATESMSETKVAPIAQVDLSFLSEGFHLNHSKEDTILSYYIIVTSRFMLASKTNHYKLLGLNRAGIGDGTSGHGQPGPVTRPELGPKNPRPTGSRFVFGPGSSFKIGPEKQIIPKVMCQIKEEFLLLLVCETR